MTGNNDPTISKLHQTGTISIAGSIGLLLLRICAGLTMARAGWDKFPLENWFGNQVAELGWPQPTFFAWSAATSELVGGTLLILGLATRPAAAFLAFTMAVAAFQFHELRFLTEIHVTQLYLWIYVMFVGVGPGKFSLDHLLNTRQTRLGKGTNLIRYAGVLLLLSTGLAMAASREAPPQTADAEQGISSVAVVGTFNEWDVNAPSLEQESETVWKGSVEIANAGPAEFKFVANGSWDTSSGETDQTKTGMPIEGIAEPGDEASNIKIYIPNPGQYEFRLDTSDYTYSVSPLDGEADDAS